MPKDADAEWLRELAKFLYSIGIYHADARLEEIANRLDASLPIAVAERLPEEGEDVSVWIVFENDGYRDLGIGSQVGGEWRIWGQCCASKEGEEGEPRRVTHWTSLPMPPLPPTDAK